MRRELGLQLHPFSLHYKRRTSVLRAFQTNEIDVPHTNWRSLRDSAKRQHTIYGKMRIAIWLKWVPPAAVDKNVSSVRAMNHSHICAMQYTQTLYFHRLKLAHYAPCNERSRDSRHTHSHHTRDMPHSTESIDRMSKLIFIYFFSPFTASRFSFLAFFPSTVTSSSAN